jgi:predicted RNA binding protein YcfA (HicA-like mRNA interferase family)
MAEWERKVKKDLSKNGYHHKRSGKGSHEIWGNDKGVSVTVSHTIDKNLANEILKQAGIDKKY